MALKNFKTRNGVDVDTYTTPVSVVQATIKTNSITTVDTIPMASFVSAEYLITITQGSKTRTSSLIMQTDGTSVDMTEYGIFETGGTISGIVVSATTSSTNAILQITITDAATTIARVKISKTLNVAYTATSPDAPTIGTATGGAGTASITFTAPYDNGGAAITSYRATSTPGSITGTALSSPVTVSGLTGGTAYTFVVAAINSAGVSAASAASNSVTPTTPPVEAGYISGGSITQNGAPQNSIQKLQFSNESMSTVSATLSANRFAAGSMANSGTAGYVAGSMASFTAERHSSIDKILFAGDTRTTLSATLPANRSTTGFANSGTAGYFAGGELQSGSGTNIINKLAFSNDAIETLAATLSGTRGNGDPTSFANSGTAGYVAGGDGTAGNTTVDKIIFSNDSRTSLGTILGTGHRAGSAFANSGTAGYAVNGIDANNIQKVAFSNDSRTTLASGLSAQMLRHAGFAKSGTAGYITGGGLGATVVNTVQKVVFSNDAISTITATLSGNRYGVSGMANSGTL